MRRARLSAPYERRTTPTAARPPSTAHAYWGSDGWPRPRPEVGGPGASRWPIGWRACAAATSLLLAAAPGSGSHVSVFVYVRPRVRLLGRGHSGARRRGAGPFRRATFKFSRTWAACALLPAGLQRVSHRSAHSRTPVLCFRREMLLLDCDPEVRLGPPLSCRLKLPDVCLLGSASRVIMG